MDDYKVGDMVKEKATGKTGKVTSLPGNGGVVVLFDKLVGGMQHWRRFREPDTELESLNG